MNKTSCLITAFVFLGILLAGCAEQENSESAIVSQDSENENLQTAVNENPGNIKETDFVDTTPAETLLESPAENYALSLDDLESGYFEVKESTGYLKEEDAFESEEKKNKAIELGWTELYQVLFQREESASVLLEDLVVKHEVSLYNSSEGAKEAFADWKQTIKNSDGFTILSAPTKGTESIAYRFELDGETEGEVYAYSTISFRTNNIIHTILVGGMYGGNVTIDDALHYADIVIKNLE